MTASWRHKAPEQASILTDAERDADRARLMALVPPGPVWVFAYGSLMWRPCFTPAETRPATLHGYRRRFNFWTMISRGTPARPGLGLGLEEAPGAVCQGLACRVPHDPTVREDSLQALWAREMHGGVYMSRWVDLETDAATLRAITFVIDPAHPQAAGDLTREERAEIIAGAAGKYGTCFDYLDSTVAHLAELGISDPDLDDLLMEVRRFRQMTT